MIHYLIYKIINVEKNILHQTKLKNKKKNKQKKTEEYLANQELSAPDSFIKSQKELIKYLHDPNIFITFTNKPILSTNYSSYFGRKKQYNTPAGFYAYPIVELTSSTADFAKDSKYVIATRFHGNLLDSDEYTNRDLTRDLDKLKIDFPEIDNYNRIVAKKTSPAGLLFFYIWKLSEKNFSRFSTLFLKLGYQGFYDTGEGIVHESERRQVVFFTPKTSLEIIGIFENFEKDKSLEDLSAKFSKKYDNYTEEEKLAVLRNTGIELKYMKHPSDELCIAAIRSNPSSFKYIFEPTEEMQLEAIFGEVRLIKYIENPSEKIQELAVSVDGLCIRYIKNPSEKIKTIAVSKSADSIEYINEPSEELQMLAVKNKLDSIIYILNPTINVQIEAVKRDPSIFKKINNPDEETMLYMVREHGNNIRFIKNPPYTIQVEAIKKNIYAIQWIKNPPEDLQLFVVNKNGLLIELIDNPSKEVQLAAIKNNYKAFQFIIEPSKDAVALYNSLKPSNEK